MADPIDPRDFGRLEAEVEVLKRMVADQANAITQMAQQLAEMNRTLSEARGGWRVLLMFGGAGATLSGLVAWALQHIQFKG